MTKLWARRRANGTGRRDEAGAILIIATVGIVLAVISAALAVDLGRIAQEKRNNQKLADLAALDAARVLPSAAAVSAAAITSARDNNHFPYAPPTFNVTGEIGKINAAGDCVADATGTLARVVVSSPVKNDFRPGTQTVTAVACAAKKDLASFSIGSGLANLDTSNSVLDQFLGGLVHASTSVDIVSYNGLATQTISLAALQTRLLAMGYAVGSTDDLLNTNLNLADVITASAQTLTPNSTASLDLLGLAGKVGAVGQIKLGTLISLGAGAGDAALSTQMNLFQFVTGSAQIANGSSTISIPSLTVSIPNVTSTSLSLNITERPKIFIGSVSDPNPHAKTAQVSLTLTPTISVLGTGVALPIAVTAAQGIGNLTAVACGSPKSISVDADTTGATTSANVTVSLVGISLPVHITVASSLAAKSDYPVLNFVYPGGFGPPGKQVGAAMTGLGNAGVLSATTGVGLVDGLVNTLVLPVLRPAVNAVDANVLRPILQALGVSLGTADVVALPILPDGVRCGTVGLAK